jgi:hypothetical protein
MFQIFQKAVRVPLSLFTPSKKHAAAQKHGSDAQRLDGTHATHTGPDKENAELHNKEKGGSVSNQHGAAAKDGFRVSGLTYVCLFVYL